MKNKKITQDKVVYFVNYILLALLSIAVLYPLIYVVSCSFSSGEALMSGRVKFLPVEPTLLSYKTVFEYDAIWTGYLNSIVYTFVGTIISIVLTLFAAYPLSRSDFRGGNILMKLFLFTMMFNGGLVPTYLLVRNLGMVDTIWAVVLPTAVNAYNIIVAENSSSVRRFPETCRRRRSWTDVLISSFSQRLPFVVIPIYLQCFVNAWLRFGTDTSIL